MPINKHAACTLKSAGARHGFASCSAVRTAEHRSTLRAEDSIVSCARPFSFALDVQGSKSSVSCPIAVDFLCAERARFIAVTADDSVRLRCEALQELPPVRTRTPQSQQTCCVALLLPRACRSAKRS